MTYMGWPYIGTERGDDEPNELPRKKGNLTAQPKRFFFPRPSAATVRKEREQTDYKKLVVCRKIRKKVLGWLIVALNTHCAGNRDPNSHRRSYKNPCMMGSYRSCGDFSHAQLKELALRSDC